MDTNTPQPQSPFPATPEPRSGNIGALSAAVIIVLIVAAGGFYFFYTQQQRQQALDAQVQEAGQQNTAATAPKEDTSVNSIEADLNATETSGGDADVSSLNDAL